MPRLIGDPRTDVHLFALSCASLMKAHNRMLRRFGSTSSRQPTTAVTGTISAPVRGRIVVGVLIGLLFLAVRRAVRFPHARTSAHHLYRWWVCSPLSQTDQARSTGMSGAASRTWRARAFAALACGPLDQVGSTSLASDRMTLSFCLSQSGRASRWICARASLQPYDASSCGVGDLGKNSLPASTRWNASSPALNSS